MDMNEELKFLQKFKKKIFFWGGGSGGVGGGAVGLGGQSGCERRIEVFVKIQKKKKIWGGGGGPGGGGRWGGRGRGQGGCERRIEVFVKIKKKNHSLSANTGFKSLAFILFEKLHLQNCDIKFQNFQRAITQKNSYDFFLKFHHIIYSLYSITC